MRQLAGSGTALVFDFDDALFPDETTRTGRAEHGYRARLAACLGACDRVVTCSDQNRADAERYGARVDLLATPVDTERYRPTTRMSAAGPVTVGWIGSPSTTPFLRAALPALLEVAAARPVVRFSFLGADPFPLKGLPAAFHRWEYETELTYLAGFDIGIMPLQRSPRADGKAGYKLLQYMALGLSSVASPDGVNAQITREGVTGFLADDPATWRDRLITLIDDAGRREQMGRAARAVVERTCSVDVLYPRWRGILDEALAARRASKECRR
jgi:glycosyltransferase involved in cell wall biosynthesis